MRHYILLSLIVICSLIIISCGGDEGVDLGPGGCVAAPIDATIEPSETSFDWNFGGRVLQDTDIFYLIYVVKNVDGIPLSDVRLNIDFPWAVPYDNAVVQLYDGNTAKRVPMNVCTDVNGVYTLKVEYASGCGYDYFGDFSAWSGNVQSDPVTLTVVGEDCI